MSGGPGRRALPGLAAVLALPAGRASRSQAQPSCRATVYLTIDTGWGREAEQIAAILRRRGVRCWAPWPARRCWPQGPRPSRPAAAPST